MIYFKDVHFYITMFHLYKNLKREDKYIYFFYIPFMFL
jgi:hypothetical protein